MWFLRNNSYTLHVHYCNGVLLPSPQVACCCGTSRCWLCTGAATPRRGAPAPSLTSNVSEAQRGVRPSSQTWCSVRTRAGTAWTFRWGGRWPWERWSVHQGCREKNNNLFNSLIFYTFGFVTGLHPSSIITSSSLQPHGVDTRECYVYLKPLNFFHVQHNIFSR